MAIQGGAGSTSTYTRARALQLIVSATTAGLILVGAATIGQDGASASPRETFVLSLGDRIQLDTAPVGCRVTRLAGHGRRAYLECRRTGALRGTYGVFFSGEDVLVARFLGRGEARVVFDASHSGSAKRCN